MFLIKKSRLTVLMLSIILVASMIPQDAFADAIDPTVYDDTTVRVYLTMSYDSDFLRAGDDPDLRNRGGKVLARVPIDINYTDLAEYGLEGYYRYDSIDKEYGNYNSSAIAVKPTVLMLYLRATSLYYLEREIRYEDIGNKENGTESSTLTLSGGAQHLYFTRFWGHNENLMYYVNHEFPMWYSDQGATADYILLEENDEIDVGMFSNMSFHTFGAFAYFDKTSPTTVPGEEIGMTLLSTATHEGSVPGIPMPGETIRISKDYGETWESTDIKTSSDGSFTISFDEPGVYYISAGPDFVKNVQNQMACVVPPIAVAEVKPVQVTGGKTSNPSQSTVKCKWDGQGSSVTYKVDYRTTGDTNWKTKEVSANEITVDDVDTSKCEFRITPIVRSEYVAYGENAKKLTAKASAVFRHTGYVPEGDDGQQALNEAKADALTRLQSYRSPDLYREAEQASLAAIIQSGTASINAAATVSAVQTAYNDAISQIDALKTKAQYEAEEQGQGGDPDDPEVKALAEAKTGAKAELAEYLASKDITLYRDEQKVELTEAAEQGNAAIDAAKSVDEVTAALTDAKAVLDAVKTDAQMKAEEEKAKEELEEAISNACLELDGYKEPMLYRDAEKETLMSIISEEKGKIRNLTSKEDVAAALISAKARLDTVKTDADLTREEEARKEQERKEKEEAEQKAKAAAIKRAKAARTTVSVKALKKHRAKVTWKKISGVTGYKVYRAAKKNGKYMLVKTIKKAKTLKYTDKKLKKGRKYYYKVRTYTKIDGGTYLGKWSKVKRITAK